jgi:hypothetical protein
MKLFSSACRASKACWTRTIQFVCGAIVSCNFELGLMRSIELAMNMGYQTAQITRILVGDDDNTSE